MMVFKEITNLSLTPIKHRTSGLDVTQMNLIKEAVEAAHKKSI